MNDDSKPTPSPALRGVTDLLEEAQMHLDAGRTKVAAAMLDALAKEARDAAKALRKVKG